MYVTAGMTCQGRKSVLLEGEAFDEMVQDTLMPLNMLSALRKANGGRLCFYGASEPFKMTYLEIGNENWGPIMKSDTT